MKFYDSDLLDVEAKMVADRKTISTPVMPRAGGCWSIEAFSYCTVCCLPSFLCGLLEFCHIFFFFFITCMITSVFSLELTQRCYLNLFLKGKIIISTVCGKPVSA